MTLLENEVHSLTGVRVRVIIFSYLLSLKKVVPIEERIFRWEQIRKNNNYRNEFFKWEKIRKNNNPNPNPNLNLTPVSERTQFSKKIISKNIRPSTRIRPSCWSRWHSGILLLRKQKSQVAVLNLWHRWHIMMKFPHQGDISKPNVTSN